MSLVLDIAWDRPTTAQIKATGAVGVMRYFSPDATKNITAAEVADYTANGLAVGTVFESTAGRATGGHQDGVDDAHLAEEERVLAGLPDTHRHHFAVDSDVPWSSVQAYFDGAASVVGLARTGTYGSFRVIEGAYGHGIRKLWQTSAWSGGQLSSHATLYQSGGTLLGGQADINRTLATDWGQTPRPAPPVPPPVTPLEDPMCVVTVSEKDYPGLKGWPGIFVWTSAGTLRHIVGGTPDLAEIRKLGLKEITISKLQYDSLVAGK